MGHDRPTTPDASATVAIASLDQRITLANLTDPKQPTFLDGDGTPGAPNGFVTDVAYSPDGRRLAAGYGDGTLRLWDMPAHYGGSPSPASALRLSPDGSMIVAAASDGRIRVWRRDAPAAPLVLTGHTAGVWEVVFAPDGHTLVSGSEDGTVRLWDLAAPQTPPRTVVSGPDPIQDVAVGSDGRTLVVAGASVQLWNLADPSLPPRTLAQRRAAALTAASVLDLAFSPDGKRLASTGADFTVRLWDVADPSRPTPAAAVLRGHTDTVRVLVFSPDGRTLATGGNDHTVRLWDVAGPGQPTGFGGPLRLGPLSGIASVVTGLAYTPDGHDLAIASSDETVRLWDLDANTLVRRICATAAHNLTVASWQESFRDQPFPAPPCG